ncbi:unnamed protein product, partial [Acanthocheilonema viteae]
GRIVICSSASTLFPTAGNGPYACSKFAVQSYCIIIRHELQPFGVDVIEIVPGSFESGMQNAERLIKMVDEVWYRAPQKLRDEYGQHYNEKAKKFTNELQRSIVDQDTTWIIDAYYEAIVAKRPKLLYRVGWDIFYPYSFLSCRLQLIVMKLLMHITGAPTPPTTTKNIHSKSPEKKVD